MWKQAPYVIIRWNAHFWITFNFWWSARLVNGLEPRLPPLCSQENEMLIFRLRSTSDNEPGWSMDSNAVCHPSPAKNIKCSFLDYVQLLMIGWAGQWTRTPSTTPLQPKKIKCLFLDYIQLLMIGQTGRRTRTPSTTPLQPKKENACFWITFNFWWSAGLVDGLEPHLPPLSSQKNKNAHFWIMFNFWWLAGLVNGFKPHPPPLSSQKKNARFWIMFNFWWLARLVDGLDPCLPPLSSQKYKMLIFGLCSTSDYWLA